MRYYCLPVLVWLTACGSSEHTAQESAANESPPSPALERISEPVPSSTAPGSAEQEDTAEVPPPLDPSWNVPRVSLRPGFQPAPHKRISQTTANFGVYIENTECLFSVPDRPSVLFVAEADFANLTVAVLGEGDFTLMIRTPDGEYLCNDDYNDIMPGLRGAFSAGTYEVWVGAMESPGTMVDRPYMLGFSEEADFSADDLSMHELLPDEYPPEE